MPLVIQLQTHKVVAGSDLDVHLLNGLNAFNNNAHSVAGHALLNPILNGAGYTVIIKKGGKTATNGQTVTVNVDECNVATAANAAGLNEMVESTVFELVNAHNHALHGPNEANLRAGTLPILGANGYGPTKANLEAEATWTTAQILNQMVANAGYAPSPWGHGQINSVGATLLPAYRPIFSAAPHLAGAGANTVPHLPTREMYAFKGAVILATHDNNKAFRTIFGQLFKNPPPAPPKSILIHKLGQVAMKAQFNTISSQREIDSARFFHVVFHSLTNNAGLTANLLHGAPADWTFTPGMIACAPDTIHLATAIDNAINTKMAEIV